MAKDKSGKAEKSTKPKGGNDEFAKPSEAPSTSDGWQFENEENLGKLFLITPLRSEQIDDKYKPGSTKEVIVCDIVELNERKPAKSELHENAWVFGGYTRGSLRGFIGERRVVGRLGQGEKDRGNIPWTLEDGDDNDIDVAKAYVESIDPFKQDGKSKAK